MVLSLFSYVCFATIFKSLKCYSSLSFVCLFVCLLICLFHLFFGTCVYCLLFTLMCQLKFSPYVLEWHTCMRHCIIALMISIACMCIVTFLPYCNCVFPPWMCSGGVFQVCGLVTNLGYSIRRFTTYPVLVLNHVLKMLPCSNSVEHLAFALNVYFHITYKHADLRYLSFKDGVCDSDERLLIFELNSRIELHRILCWSNVLIIYFNLKFNTTPFLRYRRKQNIVNTLLGVWET